MANVERIKQCIELVQKAQNLDMGVFQNTKSYGGYAKSVEELHACGNTACFAGYLAISDFFKEAGGEFRHGSPEMKAPKGGFGLHYEGDRMGVTDTVAFFLDISPDLADLIVFGEHGGGNSYSSFYGKNFGDVTPDDVIAILERILAGELK